LSQDGSAACKASLNLSCNLAPPARRAHPAMHDYVGELSSRCCVAVRLPL